MKKRTLIIITILVVSSMALVTYIIVRPSKTRPQEPTKPYGYYSEEVTFQNPQANVTLSGTLTLPSVEGNYPAVILISGSGPQNRDGEMIGHKPFLVLSDHLTKNRIAVLRYDDRGVGKSSGDFNAGTSLDFATDVASAIAYLKTRNEINKNKIGLVGHSDGGMIAPMVAARSSDVNFIVLLAGPGIQGGKLLINRQELIERASGMSETEMQKSRKGAEEIIAMVADSKDLLSLKTDLIKYFKDHNDDIPDYAIPPGVTKEQFISGRIEMLSTPWFQYFFNYDPAPTLEKVTCPVLALNGEKDVQVPSKENLAAIGAALKKGGNDKVTIKELPNLNHLFQECKTGMVDEYATIDQTFSPVALDEISTWILKQVK
jgi:pimeloyl-ACP methyl ester carboxylesterase